MSHPGRGRGSLTDSFGISRPTAPRRFAEWADVGVFTRLHQAMLDLLDATG
jgi:hypothetical protein